MDLLNQFIFYLYNLLITKDSNNNTNEEKISNYLDYLTNIIFDNVFLNLLFIFSIAAIINLSFDKKEKYKLLVFLNSLIFLIVLILFPINIPFTDSYMEINLLFDKETLPYLLDRNEGFLFLIFRFLHIIIFKFFNLNYSIIIYFNYLLFIISIVLFLGYLKKKDLDNYFIYFILIYFNAKWFVHFYEPVSIVWTINFCLILLFLHTLNLKNIYIRNISFITIYTLSLINFKAGIIIFIYSIIYGLSLRKRFIDKLFFIIVPIIVFFLINKFLTNDVGIILKEISVENYINTIKTNYLFILTNFLAIHSLIYDPIIFSKKFIFISITLVQYLYLLHSIFFIKKNPLNNLRNFILDNPLVIIGLLGCLLIVITRENYHYSRYMTFSLLFQLGFFINLFKNKLIIKYSNKIIRNLLISFFLISYFINLLITNQGIFFAFKKNYIYSNVKNCFLTNQENNRCLKDMFYLTFYDENKKHYEVFKEDIYQLQKFNLSVFSEID